MTDSIITAALIYWGIISLVSVIVTVYDKLASKGAPKHRTPEKTLLLLAALGGSAAMYITMQLIRHKTKHAKFMIGIPVIMLLQAAALWGIMVLTATKV